MKITTHRTKGKMGTGREAKFVQRIMKPAYFQADRSLQGDDLLKLAAKKQAQRCHTKPSLAIIRDMTYRLHRRNILSSLTAI